MIEIKSLTGKKIAVEEIEFLRTILKYLRESSPNYVRVVQEEINDNGKPVFKGAMAMMLLKNPQEVAFYTDTIPMEKDNNPDESGNLGG